MNDVIPDVAEGRLPFGSILCDVIIVGISGGEKLSCISLRNFGSDGLCAGLTNLHMIFVSHSATEA